MESDSDGERRRVRLYGTVGFLLPTTEPRRRGSERRRPDVDA
jgi:hypothetical protein